MKYWRVKKGNKAVRDILIIDSKGETAENLDEAATIIFQIKKNKTDAVALLEKTKEAGEGITILTGDDLGKLRITLLPADTTALGIGEFFMGLQIKWGTTDIYEVQISIDDVESENFIVIQDIVQS